MRFSMVFAAILLALCAVQFASFTFVNSFDGTNPQDPDNVFRFSSPSGLVVGGGNLYVADSGKPALYVTNASNATYRAKIIWTQSAGDNSLVSPQRMIYENGVVYIADGTSANIKTYTGVGTQIDKWNTATNMEKAAGLALDKDNAYIADSMKKKVFIYPRSTRTYQKVAIESGGSDGELSVPADIEIYGDRYFVSDQDKGYVFVYDKNFSFLYTIGRGKGGVTLKTPKGIAAYQNRLYVADMSMNRVIVYTLDGYPVETLDSDTPEGIFA